MMALDPNSLAAALAQRFRGVGGYPATAADAGAAWASLYATYAQAATAVSPPPTSITAAPILATVQSAQAALSAALAAAFAARHSIPDLASSLASALAAFWTSVAFALASATGVTLPPITPLLVDALVAFFGPAAGPRPDADAQAHNFASLLDAWTRTIAVTNTAGAVTAVAVLS